MTNHQIFQAFCDGATSGKNSTGSLFIEGATLYSYGHHWPMAHRVGTVMVVNRDRYSVTTSKQTNQFMSTARDSLYSIDESTGDDMVKRFAKKYTTAA